MRPAARILGAAPYESGQSSYRGELQAVTRAGDPDALVLIGYVQQGGTLIMRQALEEGFARRFLLPGRHEVARGGAGHRRRHSRGDVRHGPEHERDLDGLHRAVHPEVRNASSAAVHG